ncbi:MAG: RdgB/HAM1 family non-canonical purine NTP pyrophosphatase [Armatimonadetes bacterium]|nr:RdgB/HAM1 family non-canonical purine NTP pyrophosphatase [Armatimonadota bacterium]
MTSNPRRLLVASHNAGKVREIALLLADLPLEIVGLDAVPDLDDLPEPYDTFAANAESKARTAAAHARCLALADDSGLQVPALNDRPGVHSARYAPTDEQRVARLLEEMAGLGGEQRRARFVCVIALADGHHTLGLWEGTCEGHITEAPRGAQGFGFDPVFQYGDRTFAKMTAAEKSEVSHRGRALRAFRHDLPEVLHDRT